MTCAICLYNIKFYNSITLECNHYFCASCILYNTEIIHKCPLCRKILQY